MSDSDYSFSLTTFSPSGKLVQIEYALNAVSAGKTSIGIKATNGVVLATEKKQSSNLVDDSTIHKTFPISKSMGLIYSGMGPDVRVLVKKARKTAATYELNYGEEIPATQLVRQVAAVMQEFTQSGGVRPFGVSVLIAGKDRGVPKLYQIDPSGSFWAWKACAIGKNMNNAKTFLEKRYNEDMELEDAIHTAILTLKEGFEGKMTEDNVEVSVVTEEGFRTLSKAEVKDYLGEVE